MPARPKCSACRKRVAKVKGMCRPCYDKAYQEGRRRADGVAPRELVGPASGGVKIEFWTTHEQAKDVRAAAGGNISRWLRDAAANHLGLGDRDA